MDAISNEWSTFLFEQSPNLLRKLDGIIDDETKRPGIAYGIFFTRVQRDPIEVDRHMLRDVNGRISEEVLRPVFYDYTNDNMFEINVLTDLQQTYFFSVSCGEFLQPLMMDPTTNQLASRYWSNTYMAVNQTLAADVRKAVWEWLQHSILIKLSKDRTRLLKEELVAAVWHPRRVQMLLETYGWESID